MTSAGVDAELKLLQSAASRHAHAVIDDVEAKLLINSNLQPKHIGILSRLWREKLQELTIPASTTVEKSQAIYDVAPHMHVPIPPRLTEHIRTLLPVQGCIGRPASFLKPPEYASQLRKSERKWKTEDEVVTKKKVKRVAKSSKQSEAVDADVGDLVLGIQLKVNLRALLTLQSFDYNKTSAEWVVGRVVSLLKGSAGKTKVKVRFPNGGEIDIFWPNNEHVHVLESISISTATKNKNGIAGATTAGDIGCGANADIGKNNSAMDDIFAQLIQSDSSDDDDSLHQQFLAHNAGESDALRILLGGFEEAENSNSNIVGTAASRDTTVTNTHPTADTKAQKHIVNDAQLLNIATTTTTTASINSNMSTSQHENRQNLAYSLTSGLPAHTQREVALLATGEKVDALALGEIEQKYAQYRPVFRITPDQGTAGEALQAARRRERNFTSRQWTSQQPFTNKNNPYHQEASEEEEGDREMAALMREVTLEAVEDPSLPLPEPEAVFIGKVAKKLRRGEDLWRTQLYDVTVRDLRKHSNSAGSNHRNDDNVDMNTGALTQDTNVGADFILPRCNVILSASAFSGVYSTDPTTITNGGAYHTYNDGMDSSRGVLDPVAKENLQLLLSLCET